MFDSRVNASVPGKVTMAGWPWHGYIKARETGEMDLITPAETIDLNRKFVAYPEEGHSRLLKHGSVFRFRDPRAQDVERSAEQQAADSAAGIEWRADVLFNPHESVLYNFEPRNTRATRWIYHDGERNWMVSINDASGILYFNEQLMVLGRHKKREQRSVLIYGDKQLRPSDRMELIDLSADGSRALFAEYNSRFTDSSFYYPTRFYELTISEGFNVNLREHLSASEVGPKIERFTGEVGVEAKYLKITSANVTTEPLPLEETYLVEADVSTELTTDKGRIPAVRERINTSSTYSRIIGLYYDEQNNIKELKLSAAQSITYASSGTEYSPVSASYSHTDGYYPSTNYSYMTTTIIRGVTPISRTKGTVVTVELDGEIVSRAQAVDTGTELESMSCYLRTGHDKDGGSAALTDPLVGATERAGQSYSISLDGVQIDSGTYGSGAQPSGLALHFGFGFNDYFLAQPNDENGWNLSEHRLIHVVKYTPQLMCLAVSTPRHLLSSLEKQTVSKSIVKSGAQPDYMLERANPNAPLYGSYNPITGQVIRDTTTPVFWI